ncbi:putative glycerophosphoryl diester phosphodiesterase precursor (GlpQ) [Sphaerisporangium melleum]|uniref:Glycerophosphoryl diester phosphodiesterase (GlpQ) n=1 Tax=Sphaerisporangium melleum TaxID=321316 RepID=A0A917RES4_9ACTN|nr:glycerophosphodiester phosphodiesterase family protein [Sphaerisporangium melleum]GGL03400.1 putative glycerophosphoryl diester phosphodiesterase precursor (GlpQ) [Sphaerisporangium melleum]GII74065.1 putative glycerophosphoryl diester phosphodiesterase precursor (GlpQ) [Sphaerisporangium melleum]
MQVEIHGHRGARGLRPENTLPGMAFTLGLGVHAIEFDVALTADRQLVLTHDLTVSAVTSADTVPATPADPAFPYVGKPIRALSLAQLRTLEVGVRNPRSATDRFAGTQVPVPGTRMPTLGAVLALVNAYGGDDVRLNVELKSDPTRPDLSGDPRELTELVVAELDRHGRLEGSAILSFDWRVLRAAEGLVATRYALVEEDTLSPAWLGLDHVADFGGDIAAAAASIGATTLSPDRVLIGADLMDRAAAAGLPVAVWTVNDPAEASRMIDLGVAAVVTDYPDRMRELWRTRGLPLPVPTPALRPTPA